MFASQSKLTPEELAHSRVAFWRAVIVVSLLAWGTIVYQVGLVIQEMGVLATSVKWQLAGAAGLGLEILLFGLLVITFTPLYVYLYRRIKQVSLWQRRLGFFNLLIFLISAAGFAYLVYGNRGFLFGNIWCRIGLIWLLALPAGAGLRAMLPLDARLHPWFASFLAAITGMAVIYKTIGFLPEISDYPLSLGWSEASRYYYASLFYSQHLYGMKLAWPFLHPTRYILQSLPYLLDLPLQAHRIWQVLLWLGMTSLTAWLLVRWLALPSAFLRWAVGAWAFLFLFQGPVYYHLLVCVIIILWGFRPRRLVFSLVVVVAASLWAGISRINWWPMPACLAIMLYLLDEPYSASRGLWTYLRRPLLWGIAGGASAFAAQTVYIFASGNQDAKSFGSSFSSDLLWDRLWPSPTYPPGILPMALLLSLPLLLVIVRYALRPGFHPLRQLGLAGMTLVFLAGGLVVSTKIGGGSNLHNLDAFLVLLMVWGSSLVFGRFTPETSSQPGLEPLRELKSPTGNLPWVVLLLIVVLPVYVLLQDGRMFETFNNKVAWENIGKLQARVDEVTARGGRVLFISQRHLVTFDIIKGVKMEPNYETVELMEMAMSGNPDYLDQFERDLREHRFDLIVTGELNIVYKGPQDAFPEENNVWVEHVSLPLLEYYQSSQTYPLSSLELLVPKP